MSLRKTVEDNYKELLDHGVAPKAALTARHNHAVNTIKRLVTPAKLDKMSDEKLFRLLDLLEKD